MKMNTKIVQMFYRYQFHLKGERSQGNVWYQYGAKVRKKDNKTKNKSDKGKKYNGNCNHCGKQGHTKPTVGSYQKIQLKVQ